MRKNEQKPRGGGRNNHNNVNNNNGFIPTSIRAFSNYLRVVSSGASTVASTVRSAASAASAIVDRDNDATAEQVHWAGFDKLECDGNVFHQVLLLGYQFGFQVWDVEEANNVRDLVTRYDGPVSFLQILPKGVASQHSQDEFSSSGPLVVICADGSFSAGANAQDVISVPTTGNFQNGCGDLLNGSFVPTAVWFYSLKSQSYVHVLKFRSVVYSVRCSSRVVAVLQASQVHCFNARTLERDYTILTNPISTSNLGFGSIGLGPLAVGPRWIAYGGSLVASSNSGRVSPQYLTPSASFPAPASNGSVVAHYAKESSKQLAAGIVTLGDIGYKKLSRYYSELLPEGNNTHQSSNSGWKDHGTTNGHLQNTDNIGMVIVRDVVSKSVIAQFQAHKSPISSLCFDHSGTLLVTASVQGHNINVFRIMPGLSGRSSGSEGGASYVHLYRLQRGFTNAVIQDISFSVDSRWIMISTSRETTHLFAISPSGGPLNIRSFNSNTRLGTPSSGLQMLNQQIIHASGPPTTLSASKRIRGLNNGWKSTVTGAAVAATGRGSFFSGPIASTFHNCKGKTKYGDVESLWGKYHMLVFYPSGFLTQYSLRLPSVPDSATGVPGLITTYESAPEPIVDPIQKWNVCQKQNRRVREENIDIYGENGYSDSRKIFPEGTGKQSSIHFVNKSKVKKEKVSPEERHHMFIAEAELQMHELWVPLWARPEVYFQSMMKDGIKMDDELARGGEFEIETVATHTIEARSKDLVPAVDRHVPKFHMARFPALEGNGDGDALHCGTGVTKYGRFPCGSSRGSLTSPKVVAAGELVSEKEKKFRDAPRMPIEDTKGFVNNDDSPTSYDRLEIVNNSECSVNENQTEFVNNSIAGLKIENQFEDQGDGV